MVQIWRRALKDIWANRFLNTITVVTIAMAVLIVSAFGLLSVNFHQLMDKWRNGIRMLVYLKADVSQQDRQALEDRIRGIKGVSGVTFISKEEGLARMKQRMAILERLLEDLKKNPLPDTFEVRLDADALEGDRIDGVASAIRAMAPVEEVVYGKVWLNRFAGLMHLFRLAGTAMGGLFIMAAVFIVANTLRLVLYSRQQEIEIMRLIGATDRFIKMPFFVEGLVQGFFGGLLGLAVLYGLFRVAAVRVGAYLPIGFGEMRYFSSTTLLLILGCTMGVGWIGCYLSLKGFLRR